jgi:response regulator RpfG family c-di-GMP phosphodiesterase
MSFSVVSWLDAYSQPITIAQALGELRRCAGAQFHPTVVQAFCELIQQPQTAAPRCVT